MVRLATAPGVSFALVEERAVFLDVRSDRYLALPADLEGPFNLALSRDGSIDPGGPDVGRLVETGLFIVGDDRCSLRPVEHRPPRRAPQESVRLPFRPADFLEAWMLVVHAGRVMKSLPLCAALAAPETKRLRSGEESHERDLHRLARRFQKARACMPSPLSCLPDSLALRRWLAHRGYASTLVMAVRFEPFAAHCWIERGGVVLNDTPERIASFVPVGIFP